MKKKIYALIRRMWKIQVNVTPEQARWIAWTACKKKGLGWREPVEVEECLTYYSMMINGHVIGPNMEVRVSISNGQILNKDF